MTELDEGRRTDDEGQRHPERVNDSMRLTNGHQSKDALAFVARPPSTGGLASSGLGRSPAQDAFRRLSFVLRLSSYILLTALLAWLVIYRAVNLDEGWYLGAAQSVSAGRLLYRDFAYTQTPLLPYVYGLALGVGRVLHVGPLIAGRALTLLCALAALYLTGRTARRLAGPWAEIVTLLLFAASLYAVAFYAYTATYALAALFIAVAVALAAPPGLESRHQPVIDPTRAPTEPAEAAIPSSVIAEQRRTIAAVVCLCLAVGVRLSAVAALPPFVLYLAWRSRDRSRTLLAVALAAAVTLAALFAPFVLAAGPQAVFYNIFGFHTDRMLPEWQLTVTRNALRETAVAFPLLLLTTAAAALLLSRGSGEDDPVFASRAAHGFMVTTLVMSAALALVHLIPRTAAGYYNVLQAPLLALLGGVTLAPACAALYRRAARPWLRGALVVLGFLVLAASGITQFRVLQRQSILANPPFNQVAQVRQAAAYLADHTRPGQPVMTFDTHLALEAGRPIPPGFEMGIFSYRPTWTTAQATRNHALNNEMLADLWSRADAPIALTGFDIQTLYGDTDRLLNTLHANYRWTKSIPRFGPFFDEVRLYFPPQYDAPAPQTTRRVDFAQGIALLGYDLERDRYGATETLWLGLYWQARDPLERSYTVFTHLLNEAGHVAAGQDNAPCRNTCPTTTWRTGEVIRDEYALPLTPGTYVLEIGLYDAASGERLAVLAEDGARADDRVVLATIVTP